MSRVWLAPVDSASDTIGEVKARVSGATGVPTAQMSLAYGGTALSSDSATLGGVGVPDGGLLTLAISGSVPAAAYGFGQRRRPRPRAEEQTAEESRVGRTVAGHREHHVEHREPSVDHRRAE